MKRQIQEMYPCQRAKPRVVPPGVDTNKYAPRQPDPALLARLKIRPEHRVFLIAGRLAADKNVSFAIDAFKLTSNPDSRLFILGDGPFRAKLESQAGADIEQGRIVFLGHESEPAPYYHLSHFIIMPSRRESFGHVYLEAMACGRPCIGYAGPHTAATEIIVPNETGFYFEDYTTSALAGLMDQAAALDLTDWRNMSARARQRVEQCFSWDRFVDELLRELDWQRQTSVL